MNRHLQKFPKQIVKYNQQYERALANLFIMFAPIAPLFASECWSKFLAVPNRIAVDDEAHWKWDKDVLQQKWPTVDKNMDDIFVIRVSETIHCMPISFGFVKHCFPYVLITIFSFFPLNLDKQFENHSSTHRK